MGSRLSPSALRALVNMADSDGMTALHHVRSAKHWFSPQAASIVRGSTLLKSIPEDSWVGGLSGRESDHVPRTVEREGYDSDLVEFSRTHKRRHSDVHIIICNREPT